MNCHILSSLSIFLGVIFAVFGYWYGMKEAMFWQNCYQNETDLHRKNLEHCHKVIIGMGNERLSKSNTSPEKEV